MPGAIVALVGVVFCVGAVSYGVVSGGRMGPGLMPMVSGLGLVVLGSALAVSAGRSTGAMRGSVDGTAGEPRGGADGRAVAPTEGEAVEREGVATAVIPQEVHHPRRPWIILGSTMVALLLAPYFGLIPALGLMALVVLRLVERESWVMSVGVTVALLVFSWFVFERFLAVNLPWGIFGGLV